MFSIPQAGSLYLKNQLNSVGKEEENERLFTNSRERWSLFPPQQCYISTIKERITS